MNQHEKINYVELPANDLSVVKAFFSQAFSWSFVDYGDAYCAFVDAGLDGGFYQSPLCSSPSQGGALVVLYSENLEVTQTKVLEAGGSVVQDTFDFPGGRRFHFSDPAGNEWAVWSEK